MTWLYYYASRFVFLVLFKILFRFEAFGRKNIPKTGGFILACNHVSFLDPVALGLGSTRMCSFMARESLFRNPFARAWLFGVGVIPVKRDSADLQAVKEAIRRVKDGKCLALFPEGTRSIDGRLADTAKEGVGFFVHKLDCPVVPAFIKGAQKAMPKGAKMFRPVKVSITFGEQFIVERNMPYQDISQLVLDKIRHLSCQVS